MDSIWTQTAVFPSFPALEGDLRADAAIVGGGLTGILTAWLLRQAGADVVVLEADRVGGGQTAGTTAKLTAQHGLKYSQLLETLGNEAASQYARANLTAVDHLRQLIRQQDIDCDWRDCTSFLYASDAPGPLHREYDACRALGMDVFLTRNTELSFPCEALGLRRQACFHPLKLLSALSQGLRVCEHTRVLEADGHILRTARGTVTAESILFTCHFPFVNVPGYFFIRQHQERSYVLALEGILPLEHYYLGTGGSAFSLRSSGKYLLLGGGGHRTGEHPEAGRYELLRQTARRYWPDCHVAAAWSAQDCVPMDGVPYIGRLSRRHPNWFVATGFQKWGMSSSMAAAEILSSLVRGVPLSADAAVFDPRRFPVRASARQLASDTAHAVSGLTRRFLEPARVSAEAIPPGHGGIVDLDGKKVGVYRALGSITFAYHKLRCAISMSLEVSIVTYPMFESQFVANVAEAMVKAEEQAIISGSGSGQPKGITKETAPTGQNIDIAAATTALAYADLTKAEAALPQAYDADAVWCMSKKTFFEQIVGMVDDKKQPVARVNYGLSGKPVYSLFGREVVLVGDYLPSFTASVTADTIFAFIFNFKDYLWNENLGMTFRKYTDNATDDEVTVALALVDGKCVDTNSLVTLTKKKA